MDPPPCDRDARTPRLAGPVARAQRIGSLDALRGFALCGVLAMNIALMGAAWDATTPVTPPLAGDPDWTTWWFAELFVEGSMRGLFSMLFGAGVVLMASRGASQALLYRRNLWLMAFGLIHGTLLLWPGEILFGYGLTAMLLIGLREMSPRAMTAAAAALLALLCLLGAAAGLEERAAYEAGRAAEIAQAAGAPLSEAEEDALGDLAEIRDGLVPTSSELAKQRSARLGGYLANFGYAARTFADTQLTGPFLIATVMEYLATMLLGAALMRWGVLAGAARARVYGLLALAGYGVGLPLNAFEAWAVWTSGLAEPVWHYYATYEMSRIATTLGHVGMFHLLWRAAPSVVFAPLRALGRMALTNYVGQSVIAAVLFSGFGLGLFGLYGWARLWAVAGAILVAQAVFSTAWLTAFRFGPLEWLWRTATYAKVQPLRRGQGAARS